jgi:signal transduction histidine kinase
MRAGTNLRRLQLLLVLFFLAIAIPSVVLVRHAYSQLKWEAFYQFRAQAESLSARIDEQLQRFVSKEEARPSTDYQFLVIAENTNFLQPSPLSRWPLSSDVPGLIGYFQLNAQGAFSSPILPLLEREATQYGVTVDQLAERKRVRDRILNILLDNRLAESPSLPAHLAGSSMGATAAAVDSEDAADMSAGAALAPALEEEAGTILQESVMQAADPPQDFRGFKDQLTNRKMKKSSGEYTRVDDLRLQRNYLEPQQAKEKQLKLEQKQHLAPEPELTVARSSLPKKLRSPRKEKTTLAPVEVADAQSAEERATPKRITVFESEVDPFDFALLDSGHFVLYRNVWRDGQRSIQGGLIEQSAFLQGLTQSVFPENELSTVGQLLLAFQGNVLSVAGGYANVPQASGSGELLLQTRLSAPFSDLELIYSLQQLPTGQSARVISWTALILALVLITGIALIYLLGRRQIALSQQQQDFVSSVSHELKTPLTSIRMYSEILREGWADETKRKSYYEFIFDESERLSRLIANVLQLARMNRNDIQLDIRAYSVAELLDQMRSKLSSQIDSADFELNLSIPDQTSQVMVDRDVLAQVLINLVDNALKFSSKADKKVVDVSVLDGDNNQVVIAVRDYGPGIPKAQIKKIFRLFYRAENELTRETVGTGIGLALVNQLVHALGGEVDVINREPGAEFRVTLPRAKLNK